MDIRLTPEHEAFRAEVVEFLGTAWLDHPKETRADPAFVRDFRAAATERGYLYRGIPRRLGGSEQPADVLRAQVVVEEFARARAPREVPGNGVNMLVPTLLECGAPWQQNRFVPKTLTGEYVWCQGYSEPGSGSDLASLTTSARLDGDEWVISGQKIWTSFAAEAAYMFALVRTEPDRPRHRGLSYLLLDMTAPGIDVRPLRQITGEMHFNEVFFDEVRTPADWIVGERGNGWVVSKATLQHERNALGGAARSQALYDSLVRFVTTTELRGRPAIDDPVVRDRLVALEGHMAAQRYSGYVQLTRDAHGTPGGLLGMSNKLGSTVIAHEIAAIAQLAMSDHALLAPEPGTRGAPRWIGQVFGSLGFSIAGGTSNIQRNIVAERGLGLPRGDREEPR